MHALLNVDALKPAMVNARAFENYGAKSLNGLKNTRHLKLSFPTYQRLKPISKSPLRASSRGTNPASLVRNVTQREGKIVQSGPKVR